MIKEKLEKKTLVELRNMAKELEIKGRWQLNKAELIEDIIEKIKADEEEEQRFLSKVAYIESAEEGTLVAFKINHPAERVTSSKIFSCDPEKQEITVITKKGLKFPVKYRDILWVKTGFFWPNDIFNLLKENKYA